MSQWLEGALARAEQVDDWLAASRQSSLQKLRESAWPSRKTEAWKYTSLRSLAELTLQGGVAGQASSIQPIADLPTLDLYFINGQLQQSPESMSLPEGLSIRPLADSSQPWLEQRFAHIKPTHHLFGLVNDVLATEGVVIDIAAGADIATPIRVLSDMQAGYEGHYRIYVRLGEGAQATLIEQFSGNEQSFLTTVAEFDLAAGAQLEHYRFALQSGQSLSVGGDHFCLQEQAQLNSTLVGFGSELSRVDLDVEYAGAEAQAKLNAIYLLDGEEHFDLHSTIEHAVPSCTTTERVNGIVGGSAKAVFNGRIHIHRHAQKTLAELNNLNLLMSRDAEVNTKPELEIYADDVRCAHGATVAELDKKSLYYLQTRGLSRSEAQIMLSFGFINELVNDMPNEALAEWLRPQLRARFEQMKTIA